MGKNLLVVLGTVWLSDVVVKQFTNAGDSDTERLMWRLGSAAAIAVFAGKFV